MRGTPNAHTTSRFEAAIERFDQAHAADDNRIEIDGRLESQELVYARRMSEALAHFDPNASEALRLAVHCQHLERWRLPRSTYPSGRAGYLEWRTTVAQRQADAAGAILEDVGYDASTIARVQALIRKERLKVDADVQTLEDVACLVFLQYDLPLFAARHEPEKVVSVLRKTWRKMSDRGRETAQRLTLGPSVRSLVDRAAASRGGS